MITYSNSEVYIPVYNRLKVYPTFMKLFNYKIPSIERQKDYENIKEIRKYETNKNMQEENIERSIRRTKTTITDIILSNDFDIFATFTFKKDRYDIQKSKNKMSQWLKREQLKHGKFNYIIVPEFHKDKKAIHFHALIKGYNGSLKDSGKKINSRKAYNFTSYTLGWNSAVYIDNTKKVSSYVRKYITKDMPQFNGKKRYWISTGLKRPFTDVNTDVFHNPYIKWRKVYNADNIDIYETESIVKVLTLKEKELWQSQTLNIQTFQSWLRWNWYKDRVIKGNGRQLDMPLTMTAKNFQKWSF